VAGLRTVGHRPVHRHRPHYQRLGLDHVVLRSAPGGPAKRTGLEYLNYSFQMKGQGLRLCPLVRLLGWRRMRWD
jgi:hypothetical protein